MKLGAIISPRYPPQMLQKVARHLEGLSFNSFWYPDEKFFRDCYIGLTLVCSVTSSIRCGVCVTDPYTRHPIMTAVSIATLAEIAPSRVWLGIGAGGRGFNAMRIRREKPVVALREAINIIRKLLAGEFVDYKGDIISINKRSLDFNAPSDIKILIATGYGNLIKRLGGEIADAVMLANVTSEVAILDGLSQIELGAQKSGRKLKDFELISRVDVSVNNEPELAKAAVAPKILSALRASYPNLNYLDPLQNIELPEELVDVLKQKDYRSRTYYADPKHCAHLIPDALYDHFAIAGTPQRIEGRLRKMISMHLFDEITVNPIPSGNQDIFEVTTIIRKIFDNITTNN